MASARFVGLVLKIRCDGICVVWRLSFKDPLSPVKMLWSINGSPAKSSETKHKKKNIILIGGVVHYTCRKDIEWPPAVRTILVHLTWVTILPTALNE